MRRCNPWMLSGVLLFVAVPAWAQTSSPTFSKDIAPIFQAKCQACHQPNSIAPMALITFQESRPWARSIKDRVARRQMPPWHIDPSVGVTTFKNDMSLSDSQIDTIVRWVDAGAPQGDPKDMPPAKALVTNNEWQGVTDGFGAPDLVVKSSEYTMPAVGQDVWYRPMTDIPLTEPRWVKMVEIRPTNMKSRKIVHHSIAYLVLNDDPRRREHRHRHLRTVAGLDARRSAEPPAAAHGMGDRQGLRQVRRRHRQADRAGQIGRASCRERV